jgi:hypothetical protein
MVYSGFTFLTTEVLRAEFVEIKDDQRRQKICGMPQHPTLVYSHGEGGWGEADYSIQAN